MFLANFDFEIINMHGEDNSVADTLSQMPTAIPDASLATCALTYMQSPLSNGSLATGALHIEMDEAFLKKIVAGYKEDTFAQQVQEGIDKESIVGARLEAGLIYLGHCLLIPSSTHICKLLSNLAHNTLGHYSFKESYAMLWDLYYWPHMHCDLECTYIPSCILCQRNKNCTTKSANLLNCHSPKNPSLFSNREYTQLGPVVMEDSATDHHVIDKIIDECRQG
ncbi:hypothetical protein J132_04557 [Termitomyces sp. J132]|nr:hypothetical protein J132_04557 [Termitomyces sp. J132]